VKILIRIVRALLGLAGLLAALPAAALACAAQGGRWSERLDVLTHFAPVWLVLGLAGLALSLAGWGRRAGAFGAVLGAAAVIASGALIVPELTRPASPRVEAAGPTLKLIQFNLWGENRAPEATLKWILEQDADVVILEEAFGNAKGLNARLRAAYPHWSSCDLPRPCSVMVMSRLPMTERGSDTGPPTAWATYVWNGKPVTVAGAHYFWPYPPGMQQWQSKGLGGHIANLPKGRLIVAGDMNSTPWSFMLRRQDQAFGLERRTRALFSWPARQGAKPFPFPILAIDQVYAGPEWRTVSVRRGPRLGSDHYPVLVELAPG
jgi:endonuclease/exonuclease/phosphatase (EEP) superfamily protein YafD